MSLDVFIPAKRTITVDGVRYTLKLHSDGVIQITGQGLGPAGTARKGFGLWDADLPARLRTIRDEQAECNRKAREVVQEAVRTRTAGLTGFAYSHEERG